MTRKHWGILGGMALALNIQSTFAGDAWLVITSNPPGATIAVDNVYRGVTPQRPSDALRLQVPKGVRQINARIRVDGKDYTTKQTVRVRSNKEIAIKLNLNAEPAPVSAIPATSATYAKKPGREWDFFPGKVEVPGRNF